MISLGFIKLTAKDEGIPGGIMSKIVPLSSILEVVSVGTECVVLFKDRPRINALESFEQISEAMGFENETNSNAHDS